MKHKPGSLEESAQQVLVEYTNITIELEAVKLTTPRQVSDFLSRLKRFSGITLAKTVGTSAFIQGSQRDLKNFLLADGTDGGFGMSQKSVRDIYGF